jgi:hypothetical protein
MLPIMPITTGGTPEVTIWVGLVPEVGKFVAQLFENDKAICHFICKSNLIEKAELEAIATWPHAEFVNGVTTANDESDNW